MAYHWKRYTKASCHKGLGMSLMALMMSFTAGTRPRGCARMAASSSSLGRCSRVENTEIRIEPMEQTAPT